MSETTGGARDLTLILKFIDAYRTKRMPTWQSARPPQGVIKDGETHWTVLGVVVLEQRGGMKE